MSRMLQALKNLDGKGAPHVTPVELPSRTSNAPVRPKNPILQALQVRTAAPAVPPTQAPELPEPEWQSVFIAQSAPAVALPLALPQAMEQPVELTASPLVFPPLPTPGRPSPAASPAAAHEAPQNTWPLPTAEATAMERAARKNLSDAARAAPYRQLVDRLRQEFRTGSGNCLLFTGIGPESAADELLLHAAMAHAEAGESVLLLDADLGRGRLSQALVSGNPPGLAEVLSHRRDWRDFLQGTHTEQLYLLPAGQLGLADPSAAADELAKVLEQVEREFRVVLVDGGRAGDLLALTLGRLCDATYFVIRLGSTDSLEAQETLRRYRSLGARVLGCVATNVSPL